MEANYEFLSDVCHGLTMYFNKRYGKEPLRWLIERLHKEALSDAAWRPGMPAISLR